MASGCAVPYSPTSTHCSSGGGSSGRSAGGEGQAWGWGARAGRLGCRAEGARVVRTRCCRPRALCPQRTPPSFSPLHTRDCRTHRAHRDPPHHTAHLHGAKATHKVDVEDAVHAEVERVAADVALAVVGPRGVLGVEDLVQQGQGRGQAGGRKCRQVVMRSRQPSCTNPRAPSPHTHAPLNAAQRSAPSPPKHAPRTSCAASCISCGSLCTSPKMVTRALASPVHPGICTTTEHRGSSRRLRVWMARGDRLQDARGHEAGGEERGEGAERSDRVRAEYKIQQQQQQWLQRWQQQQSYTARCRAWAAQCLPPSHLKIGCPAPSAAKSTSEPNGKPARRWCMPDITVHRCAYCACSTRLRTADDDTGGGGQGGRRVGREVGRAEQGPRSGWSGWDHAKGARQHAALTCDRGGGKVAAQRRVLHAAAQRRAVQAAGFDGATILLPPRAPCRDWPSGEL